MSETRPSRARHRHPVAPAAAAMLLLFLVVPATALAAPGGLDPSFGTGGTVAAPRGEANAMALQANGRIVVAGEDRSGIEVARYDTDGTLDAGFGVNGRVSTTFGTGRCDAYAFGVAVQPDQKIVVAGTLDCGTREAFILARYDTGGSLDPGFGGDGRVTTRFGGRHARASAEAVALQSDGKIVAAGVALRDAHHHRIAKFALARYETDGSLDTSFGGDGRVTTNLTRSFDYAFAVAVQTDGKIVAAGTAAIETNAGRFALVRYRTDGSLDPTFGRGGSVTTSFRNRHCGGSEGRGLALQPDGRIVLAGEVGCGHPYFALARYRTDGRLDPTFSTDGRFETIFSPRDCADLATSVAVQANAKIVAAGTEGCFSPKFGVIRTTPGGRLDRSFGHDGYVATRVGAGSNCFDQANSLAIQPDDKIVAAGIAGCSTERFGLARYLAS